MKNKKQKWLVVVDMQNDFITGSLGSNEARSIVPRVVEEINKHRENGFHIVCTKDTHNENYLNTQEGKKLPIPHCIKGTDGHELIPEVIEAAITKRPKGYRRTDVVEKPTFTALSLTGNYETVYINDDLDEHSHVDRFPDNLEEVHIIGVCTDICVVSNALYFKAVWPEIPIKVIADACAGTTPENHEAALKVMKSCQIEIV